MRALTLAAISASTRASYAAPLRRYVEWCGRSAHDPSASSLTWESAASFLAELASEGELFAASIRTHRSALSTWWAEALLPGACPLDDPRMTRLMEGVAKTLRAGDSRKRASRTITISLTFDLIRAIDAAGAGTRATAAEDIMRWAAVTLGAYGGLRPNEFLSTPGKREHAMRPEALLFFTTADSPLQSTLPPPGAASEHAPVPDRFRVDLGATKADPLGRDRYTWIAAPRAVRAMWRWVNLRRALAPPPNAELFRVPGSPALSQSRLTLFLSTWAGIAMGTPPPKVTGRCFRRGMASSLMASGAPLPSMQATGRWRGAAMPAVYSDAASMEARRIAVSRAME